MRTFLIFMTMVLMSQNALVFSSIGNLDKFEEDNFSTVRPLIRAYDLQKMKSQIAYESAKKKRKVSNEYLNGARVILPKKMNTGFLISRPTEADLIKECALKVRPRIIKELRNILPETLIVTSGFTSNELTPLDAAGAYCRLGQGLKQCLDLENKDHFAAFSFLTAGSIYADIAYKMNQHVEMIKVLFLDVRTDLLLSAAQCCYWSFCNEKSKKAKKQAIYYFALARNQANKLCIERKDFWLGVINKEYEVFRNKAFTVF